MLSYNPMSDFNMLKAKVGQTIIECAPGITREAVKNIDISYQPIIHKQ